MAAYPARIQIPHAGRALSAGPHQLPTVPEQSQYIWQRSRTELYMFPGRTAALKTHRQELMCGYSPLQDLRGTSNLMIICIWLHSKFNCYRELFIFLEVCDMQSQAQEEAEWRTIYPISSSYSLEMSQVFIKVAGKGSCFLQLRGIALFCGLPVYPCERMARGIFSACVCQRREKRSSLQALPEHRQQLATIAAPNKENQMSSSSSTQRTKYFCVSHRHH